MKSIFKRKALAFLGGAAVLLAAAVTSGCKTEVNSDSAPETFTVEIMHGEYGTRQSPRFLQAAKLPKTR